jgi:hypothetical protein
VGVQQPVSGSSAGSRLPRRGGHRVRRRASSGRKAWLENVMIEGMEAVLNDTDEVHIPVDVEGRIARSWGEEGQLYT